jgi:hypothetical protein
MVGCTGDGATRWIAECGVQVDSITARGNLQQTLSGIDQNDDTQGADQRQNNNDL